MPAETTSDQSILQERADHIISLYGGPFESPNFQERGVPGIWGNRTQPLPAIDSRGDLNGTIYLAQQWPSLATVLIHEDRYGNRGVTHNFDLVRPFNKKINEHLFLKGKPDIQNPTHAKTTLDYMERAYDQTEVKVSSADPSAIAKLTQRIINRFTKYRAFIIKLPVNIERVSS